MNFLREFWLRRVARNLGGARMQIECPDGWYRPMRRALVALARQKRNGYIGHDFEVDEIEDKFSVARIRTIPSDYLTAEMPAWDAVKTCAESCSETCDACGARGAQTYDDHGWFRTRCAAHMDEREAANARMRLAIFDIRKARRQLADHPNPDLEMAVFCQDRINTAIVEMAK